MDPNEIKALIEAFGQTGLAEMELTHGDWTLRLVRSGPGAAVAQVAAPRPATVPVVQAPRPAPAPAEAGVRAPLSGVAYLNASPGAPDFVTLGQRVEAGEVVAVIEAMKVFNEIRADQGGVVEALLVAPGDEVDAGQLLMRIG
jgi:acetyl-CoA carboxylase biotin carboxyl carrier protein